MNSEVETVETPSQLKEKSEPAHVHGPNCSHDHHHHHHAQVQTFVRPTAKVGRNELCPCGSQQKFKKCHGK